MTYNDARQLIQTLGGEGQIQDFTYDAFNRLTNATFADEQTKQYTYDQGPNGIGRLSSLLDNTGSYRWHYNAQGRINTRQQTIGSITATTAYHFNETGQLNSMTYPSGKVLSYHYTDAELTRLELDGNPILSNLQYQPFGPIKAWTWGNGATHTRSFDLDGRLSTHKLHQDTRSLSYDNADRITQTDNGETTDYTVDELSNQLLASASPTIQQNLEYDANGNTLSDGNHEYGYDARNRLTSLNNGQVTYGINAFGLQAFANSEPTHPIGDRFNDPFDETDNTPILDRENNTWQQTQVKANAQASIQNNQAHLSGGMVLSQNIGVLNSGDIYTITAKLTQGELSIRANQQTLAKIRYGFGSSIILEAGGNTHSFVTRTVREQLNVTLVLLENQVFITAIGADGAEYSSGQITQPGLTLGTGLSVQIRDYFTGFLRPHRPPWNASIHHPTK